MSVWNIPNVVKRFEFVCNCNIFYKVNYFFIRSVWKLVRDNLYVSYWDKMEAELNDDPPEYEHAIKLVEDIRTVSSKQLHHISLNPSLFVLTSPLLCLLRLDMFQILLSFLNPGANRMRTQIMEVLDMDLIRQQAENGALDIRGLASYIITTMGKLSAPVRDPEIRKLQESTDNIVTLLK